MSNFVISLAMGGGIGALALVAAAYWWGLKAGKDAKAEVDAGKVARRTTKMHDELLKERTASDVEKTLNDGTF